MDIYIPELKLAIEYNGDYWHNLANEELEVGAFIDGAQVGNSHLIQGRGTGKPVALSWQADYFLLNESAIELRARNNASGSTLVEYRSAHMRIDASWRETLQN